MYGIINKDGMLLNESDCIIDNDRYCYGNLFELVWEELLLLIVLRRVLLLLLILRVLLLIIVLFIVLLLYLIVLYFIYFYPNLKNSLSSSDNYNNLYILYFNSNSLFSSPYISLFFLFFLFI